MTGEMGWTSSGLLAAARGRQISKVKERKTGQKWFRWQRVVFFSKSIFPFVFKFYFANLKLIGGFKLF
jgi:hypothetical protein